MKIWRIFRVRKGNLNPKWKSKKARTNRLFLSPSKNKQLKKYLKLLHPRRQNNNYPTSQNPITIKLGTTLNKWSNIWRKDKKKIGSSMGSSWTTNPTPWTINIIPRPWTWTSCWKIYLKKVHICFRLLDTSSRIISLMGRQKMWRMEKSEMNDFVFEDFEEIFMVLELW